MTNAGEHKPNDFTPVIGALNLADYVITITDNLNKFPDFAAQNIKGADGAPAQIIMHKSDSLTNIVREQARRIFMLTYTANEINLNRQPWRKEERLRKQAEAISLCGEHLAMIRLCRKHFHLSTRKIKHWGGMVRELRIAIERWHEKDKDRYKHI